MANGNSSGQVTLDMSKAQPIAQAQPVTLDLSKAQPIPPANSSFWDRFKTGTENFVNTMPIVGPLHEAAGAVQNWAAKKIAPENPTLPSPAATFGYGALRDTAGLVRGATSPQGLAATVGTVALPEAAALGLIAHGVYSGIKGWGDLKNPDVLQNELNAGAEVAGGAALGGAAVKVGGGPVTQAVRGAIKGSTPAPTDDIRMAIPPSKSAPYQDADLQVAHRYLQTEHAGNPIESVQDFRDSADSAISGIEDKVKAAIAQNAQANPAYGTRQVRTTIPSPLQDVRQALSSSVRKSFIADGIKALDDYPLDQPLTLQQADDVRWQLNQDNKAILKRNNYDVATARATDPGFAAREAAAESLRNGIYDTLEQQGLPGIRELRLDEGSLIKIRNAAQNQIFNGDKVVRSSAQTSPVRQGLKAVTKMGLTAGGATIAGPAGAVAGSTAGEAVGSVFTPEALTRDALIERSFAGGGAPSPRLPLAPAATGALAAQSGLVRDPITGRMLRLAEVGAQ